MADRFEDDSILLFGVHARKPLKTIPRDYFQYIWNMGLSVFKHRDGSPASPELLKLRDYIVRNRMRLEINCDAQGNVTQEPIPDRIDETEQSTGVNRP